MSSRLPSTRTVILEAALAALEENPHAVNVRRVAQLAGLSRQAVYLHFASRAELLLAAARFVDERLDLPRRLDPTLTAESAERMLRRYAEFLADYNPLLYAVARAADAVRASDPEVAAAWADRLAHRRRGGYQIAQRLGAWNRLAPQWTVRAAGDWLTAQSSVKVWEELVLDLGWSRARFVKMMATACIGALLTPGHAKGVGGQGTRSVSSR